MAVLPIDIHSDRAVSLGLEKHLRELLKHVPPEHLIGLERITVIDSMSRKNRNARGTYQPAYDNRRATIQISVDNIFGGLPRWLLFVPAVVQFTLAQTLFHEIGHHHEARLLHGTSKADRERAAERYKSKMVVWAFRRWRPFTVFFAPIIRPALWVGRWALRRVEPEGDDGRNKS